MGGGLLPVSFHDNKVLFLLGREYEENNGAILVEEEREKKRILKQQYVKGEELNGFFGCKTVLRNYVRKYAIRSK